MRLVLGRPLVLFKSLGPSTYKTLMHLPKRFPSSISSWYSSFTNNNLFIKLYFNRFYTKQHDVLLYKTFSNYYLVTNLLATLISIIITGGTFQESPTSHSYWDQTFTQPYFDNSTKREVTTTVGQSAYLHCRVRNLGDRAVSCCLLLTSIKF